MRRRREGRDRFLRAPTPVWIPETAGSSPEEEAALQEASRLFRIRRLVWKGNLWLVGILLVTHLFLNFLLPDFAAAEWLGIELGVLESGTLIVTRRTMKREEKLKAAFLR